MLRTLKHIIKRDEKYIIAVSEFDENADYIQVKHNGRNDYGKIIYVIKEQSGVDGFGATAIYTIFYLLFAKQNGFEPVIRFSKDFTYFDEEKSKEIPNPWEYYFTINENSYDENEALNVCYCNYRHLCKIKEYYNLSPYKIENYSDESIVSVCSPIIREYLSLKPAIVNEASNLLKPVTERGGKILGVHFRGTDYKQGYNRHPVYVDENQTIEEIKRAIDTGRFEAVFLATDDASMFDKVSESLEGIPVLAHPDVFRSDGNQSVAFSNSSREYHHYLLGYEIARDIYSLSLCDGLVAGKSSVGFLGNLYKRSREEQYEYMCIIDNGNNVNDNEYYKE